MKSRGILTFLIAISVSCVSAIDLPTFYRVPFFQGTPTNHDDEWKTSIQLRAGFGDTCESFNTGENRTCLFNEHGPFSMLSLGSNVENKDKKPITSFYWNKDCVTGLFDYTDQQADDFLKKGDGEFVFGGKFKTTELDVTIRQNLLWGFYFQAYAAYRDLKISDIGARNKGQKIIKDKNDDDLDIQQWFAGTLQQRVNGNLIDTGLPQILSECGLCPFDREFKKSAVGDIVLSAGWHKYKDKLEEGPLTSLGGLVQTGLLIPMAKEVPSNQVFAVPAGYHEQFGVLTRIKFEAGLWDWVALGFNLGALIFFRNDKCMRLKTDKRQNGWISLETGNVNFDQGTIWDIGAYLRTGWRWVKGLSLIVGYSYNKQERTRLKLEDDQVLKTFAKKQLERCKLDCPQEFPIVVSKDHIINCDRRLAGWEMQAVHAVIEFDTGQHIKGSRFAPLIRFEYNASIAGKHVWDTTMVAGTLGLVVSWDF